MGCLAFLKVKLREAFPTDPEIMKPRYCPCSSTRFAVTTWSSETWKHAKCIQMLRVFEVAPQILGLLVELMTLHRAF